MTVKELVEFLSKLDPSLPIVVDGYEGGVDYLELPIDIVQVELDVYESSLHYGKHEIRDPEYLVYGFQDTGEVINAVYLEGARRK